MKILSDLPKIMFKFGKSVLLGQCSMIGTGRLVVQTPLGAWSGLGIKSRYEAPGDLQLEIVKTQ